MNPVKKSENIFLVRIPYYICVELINKKNKIMSKSIFYHAGCPVCVSAEQDLVHLIGNENVEIVHLGEDQSQIATAEKAGVQSVPALLTPNGNVLHINFGAAIADVKA